MSGPGKEWRRVLLWLALVKVVYLEVVYVALTVWPDLDEQKYYQVMRHWPMEGDPECASHFATWDGAHYLYLSTRGYAVGVNSCAFYPLWPLMIRWFSMLTGGNHLIAGLVLANFMSLAAWTLFYHIAARRFGTAVARWALVFLVVFPGSIFYQFIYTEPLFLLLTMLLWFGLEGSRYGLASVAAFLLPVTRGVGVFSVLPIAWHWLMKQSWCRLDRWRWLEAERARVFEGQERGQSMDGLNRVANATGLRWRDTGLLAAPLLGWTAYLGLMWIWTGNPVEGIEAQKHWGVHSISNLWNLPKFVIGFFEPTTWHAFRGSVFDRCAFLLLLCSLPLIWRLGKDLVVWTCVLGILPAMSGTFTSFTRFESTVFPLFIGLAVFFTSLKPKWPLWTFVILNAILHAILLWRFVNFRWAG